MKILEIIGKTDKEEYGEEQPILLVEMTQGEFAYLSHLKLKDFEAKDYIVARENKDIE